MNLGQEIRTVLVTGGTGFIGGAVAQRLRSENYRVRTLVRRNSDTAALTAAGCPVGENPPIDPTARVNLLALGRGPQSLALYANIWPNWYTGESGPAGMGLLHRSLDRGKT